MRISRSGQSRTADGAVRRAAIALAVLVVGGVAMTACSSSGSSGPTTTGSASGPSSTSAPGGRAPIPSSAFTSTIGVTPSTITIGNVSTETAGLFTGSVVGTEAYADYVNSTGGVDGRKLVVDARDDQFTGAGNKQLQLLGFSPFAPTSPAALASASHI